VLAVVLIFYFKKVNPVLTASVGNAYSNDQSSYVAISLLSADIDGQFLPTLLR
jgi:hypothetical protein